MVGLFVALDRVRAAIDALAGNDLGSAGIPGLGSGDAVSYTCKKSAFGITRPSSGSPSCVRRVFESQFEAAQSVLVFAEP